MFLTYSQLYTTAFQIIGTKLLKNIDMTKKNYLKVILKDEKDFKTSLENPNFCNLQKVLYFLKDDLNLSFIKIVTAKNLVLEVYKDKYNHLIFRQYEKV